MTFHNQAAASQFVSSAACITPNVSRSPTAYCSPQLKQGDLLDSGQINNAAFQTCIGLTKYNKAYISST